ncbi:hypothetical protein DXG03_008987 [Asterophora parasitica]|uniref:Uncharacterized protein n=1 Tax=Asterophora parasitica TaxID=117018 RepID=A0A9P7GBU3_9AGAR|nr:hypothetical protein DXG03_008987 [Asterophora parasitica]
MFFKTAVVSFLAAAALAVTVNAAPEAERRQIGSAFDSITSAAASAITGGGASIISDITSVGGGVASDVTSIAGGVFETVTSVGGHAVTVVTSAGGAAITLAGSAGGVATSFGGSVYTAATGAAATGTSNSAIGAPSFGFTSLNVIGLATIMGTISADTLKAKFLEEADSKKNSIESEIGFTNGSMLALPETDKSTSSSSGDPFTVLAATGTAIVYASGSATRTVMLNLAAPAIPAPIPTGTAGATAPITTPPITTHTDPYTILTTGSAIVFAFQGTTRTVTLNSTSASSVARASTPSATEAITVLTATGSAIVLASQGETQRVTLNATTTVAPLFTG